MAILRRQQDLKPQRAIESDSWWHFVGAQCDRADPLDHGQNSPVLFPCAVVVDTSPPPFFAVLRVRRPATPSHGDGARRAWSSASKKGATIPRAWNCRHFSARLHRKDKDLAGVNKIWISDLVPVRFVNDCVSHARAVGDTADAPQAVATRYDRGRDLGLDHGGR